jgi:hypothetical protein
MKSLFLLLLLLSVACHYSYAQPSKGKKPAKTKLDDLKNPFDTTKKVKPVVTNTPNQGGVNNEKLDDLKNPFDTTKKVKPVQQQTSQQNQSHDRYANLETNQLRSDCNEVAIETLEVKPADKPNPSQNRNSRRKRKG